MYTPRPALGICPPPTSLYYSFLCCSLAHYLFSGTSVRLKRLLKVWMRTLCVGFVSCGHSLSGSGVERKAEIVGNERCSRGKVNFHFCRPFWLVCSVVVVGIGHYLITAFYNQSSFSFYPGMVSFPKAPPPLVLWPHYHPPPALPFGASRWNLRQGFACGRLIASEIPVLMELILLLWSLCSAFELVSRVIVWGCINWLASKLCVLLSLWWILHLELREMLVKHETTTEDMPMKRYTCTHIHSPVWAWSETLYQLQLTACIELFRCTLCIFDEGI